jgi:4-amino-4-deoxy-L-arabinose transferase-like glycosyltransferase
VSTDQASTPAGASAAPTRARPVSLPAALRSPLWLIGAITLAAAVLRLDRVGVTRTNPFYDAAVRSMGTSWHAFFYGAYEPGGSVSIDKPPIDLWLQVASTKLFGFNSRALILPQALAATAAVPLLYDLVRRVFGRPAGLAAAAALAVLPVSVETARSDTMDSLMMALSVLAAWLVVRAIERRSVRWLYLGAVVAGLNFEVKLFEALAAVPALALLYALGSWAPLRRRAIHLAVAGLVFLVAALWWPIAVSLTPRASRPFPIGSVTGSVWNVMFVYNGTARVSSPAHAHSRTARGHGRVDPAPPGPLRLFGARPSPYGQLVGIELAAAFVLALLALLLARRGGVRGPPLQVAFVAFIALWLLPSFLLFSKVGTLHLRYLEAFTPALAAAFGIGLTSLAAGARRSAAAAAALLLGLGAVVAYALAIGLRDTEVVVLTAAAAVVALGVATWRGDRARAAVAVAGTLAVVALLAGPAAHSVALVQRGATDSGRPGDMAPRETLALSHYLRPRTATDRYEVASAFFPTPGRLIEHDARRVLVLTSVGRRPVIPTRRFIEAVRRGEVHYILIGGTCGTRPLRKIVHGCPSSVQWARRHSVDVSAAAGLPERGLLFRFTRHL